MDARGNFGPEDRFREKAKPDPTAPPRLDPTPYSCTDPHTLPRRQFLYARHFIRGYLAVLVAPGGTGKTALTIAETLDMATGRSLLGFPGPKLRVWYWNGEDPKDELERRFAAARLHYDIDGTQIGDRLFVDSGLDTPLKIATQQGYSVTIATPVVGAVIDALTRAKIDVLIVDPFVTTHEVSENDNTAIGIVAGQFKHIAHAACVAVGLVHHVRKPSGPTLELTADDSRGARSLIDAARSVRVINVMTVEEADKKQIPAHDRTRHFRVDDGKQNMMRPAEFATWRKLETVDLGNGAAGEPGDQVQVAAPWVIPGALDGIFEWHLREVEQRMGGSEFAQAPQASDWLGHLVGEVTKIDVRTRGGRLRMQEILNIWLKNGFIAAGERYVQKQKRMQPTFLRGGGI